MAAAPLETHLIILNVGPHCSILGGRWCQRQLWIWTKPRKVLSKCIFRNQEECEYLLSRCCVQTLGWVLCMCYIHCTHTMRPHIGHLQDMKLGGRKLIPLGNLALNPDPFQMPSCLICPIFFVLSLFLTKQNQQSRCESLRVPDNSLPTLNQVFITNSI